VLTSAEEMQAYGHDETEDLAFRPAVVVKPLLASEVAAIVSECWKNNIPVTPRGAGTGLSGGALPVFGGVVLSLERMNRIVEVDTANGFVITEPGVITEVLQDHLKELGWFYPPDPASRGSCFIGGNVAENSGGPKAVKYGVVKDYVLNLEMVLPNGALIWTGANVMKNATGYNLTQLVVGSEGTLGIVTRIVLRIIPHPTHTTLLLAPFRSAAQACEAVQEIFKAGITPSGLEFMERDAIDWTLRFHPEINLDASVLGDSVQAHLLIELDGMDPEILLKDAEKVARVLQSFEMEEVLFAETAAEKDNLWRLRRSVAESVKAHSIYKEEDTVVPRGALPLLLKGVKEIGSRYGFRSVCYGHAGDGNLHVNIIKGALDEQRWKEELPKAIRELFTLVVSLGGALSGEHGIGYVQKPYMDIAFNATQLGLMRAIKKVFDPKGIMNPGKVIE